MCGVSHAAPVPYSEAGDAAEVSSSLHTFAHSQGLVTGGFASCLCRRLHYLPGFVLQVRVALYPELNEKGKVVGGAGVGGGAGGSDSDDSDATVDADEPLTASAAVSAGRRGKDIHPTPISSGPSECCAGGVGFLHRHHCLLGAKTLHHCPSPQVYIAPVVLCA